MFANEADLTTTQVSTGRAYTEQKVIDSNGDLYAIKKDTAIGGVPSVWRDMGTKSYRVFLEMKLVERVNLEQVRNMVREQVRSPRNQTSRPPERLRKVEGHIQSYRTLQELIAGCAKQWEWID